MSKSVGFLQDEQENDSTGRLMALSSLLAAITQCRFAIAFGSYTITHAQEVGNVGKSKFLRNS
jgi:hypothetical protein